jgi:hypothetical protein
LYATEVFSSTIKTSQIRQLVHDVLSKVGERFEVLRKDSSLKMFLQEGDAIRSAKEGKQFKDVPSRG